MKDYCIYLRKSRADLEAEARGEGETLARHKKALLALAERSGYHVAQIYQEIASGDTIAARPQMQALLAAVQEGRYAGVIVNDADRLARGDGADQAFVSQAFTASGTLIITPYKVYNPANPQDEDFFDFSLFMARFEYKQIKRRMQTGRARSAAEGNYQSGPAPYGYVVVKNAARSGYTLEIDPAQADVVRMIFSWYAQEEIGKNTVAHRLNEMGLRTSKGYEWTPSTVFKILRSRLYIGDYVWRRHLFSEQYVDGQRRVTRTLNADPVIAEGCFPPIVDRAVWDQVQRKMDTHIAPSVKYGTRLTNPLAGLVKCSVCGMTMVARSYREKFALNCRTVGCATVGCYLEGVERALLEGLQGWVDTYSNPGPAPEDAAPSASQLEMDAIRRQMDTVRGQLESLHDLLEQGVYSPRVFIQRREGLEAKLAAMSARLDELRSTPTEAEAVTPLLPQIRTLLDAYPLLTDPVEKNTLLKSVLSRVEYTRTVDARGRFSGDPARFVSLQLFPRTFDK